MMELCSVEPVFAIVDILISGPVTGAAGIALLLCVLLIFSFDFVEDSVNSVLF